MKKVIQNDWRLLVAYECLERDGLQRIALSHEHVVAHDELLVAVGHNEFGVEQTLVVVLDESEDGLADGEIVGHALAQLVLIEDERTLVVELELLLGVLLVAVAVVVALFLLLVIIRTATALATASLCVKQQFNTCFVF